MHRNIEVKSIGSVIEWGRTANRKNESNFMSWRENNAIRSMCVDTHTHPQPKNVCNKLCEYGKHCNIEKEKKGISVLLSMSTQNKTNKYGEKKIQRLLIPRARARVCVCQMNGSKMKWLKHDCRHDNDNDGDYDHGNDNNNASDILWQAIWRCACNI